MMELGATWALDHQSTNIGLPDWDYNKGSGPNDSSHMSIMLDSYADAYERLDKLRVTIIEIFGLEQNEDNEKWLKGKKEFFNAIKKIHLKMTSVPTA